MSYISAFSTRAQKEIAEAWEWYEDRQPGLGDRFTSEVKKRIKEIEQNPKRYAEKISPYRETRTKVFPYLIVYRIKEKQKVIVIVSIFHGYRDPLKKYR